MIPRDLVVNKKFARDGDSYLLRAGLLTTHFTLRYDFIGNVHDSRRQVLEFGTKVVWEVRFSGSDHQKLRDDTAKLGMVKFLVKGEKADVAVPRAFAISPLKKRHAAIGKWLKVIRKFRSILLSPMLKLFGRTVPIAEIGTSLRSPCFG